jgi:hypothetical protein
MNYGGGQEIAGTLEDDAEADSSDALVDDGQRCGRCQVAVNIL